MNDEAAVNNHPEDEGTEASQHAFETMSSAAAKRELVSQARRVFGDRLAEFILTHDADHLIGLDRVVVGLDASQMTPLRDAVSIRNELLAVEAPRTIQAWFVGMNRLLGDRASALVIRKDPEAVRRAAKYFLAYG